MIETTTEKTSHACAYILRLQVLEFYVNAFLQRNKIRVCFKKSQFECCFWSAQCFERQARMSGIVRTWIFRSLNEKWWNFLDNCVYCNILRSIKISFLKVEKALFIDETLVPMFTILPLSLLVLILAVKNERHFMLSVTWR